mmetsp:Transcript_80354/g.239356  ORF Transcript_80354/g.239356 Transcript_80354/m.239356 type:complete len:433 (-) Transcript_80354:481-1779(-)
MQEDQCQHHLREEVQGLAEVLPGVASIHLRGEVSYEAFEVAIAILHHHGHVEALDSPSGANGAAACCACLLRVEEPPPFVALAPEVQGHDVRVAAPPEAHGKLPLLPPDRVDDAHLPQGQHPALLAHVHEFHGASLTLGGNLQDYPKLALVHLPQYPVLDELLRKDLEGQAPLQAAAKLHPGPAEACVCWWRWHAEVSLPRPREDTVSGLVADERLDDTAVDPRNKDQRDAVHYQGEQNLIHEQAAPENNLQTLDGSITDALRHGHSGSVPDEVHADNELQDTNNEEVLRGAPRCILKTGPRKKVQRIHGQHDETHHEAIEEIVIGPVPLAVGALEHLQIDAHQAEEHDDKENGELGLRHDPRPRTHALSELGDPRPGPKALADENERAQAEGDLRGAVEQEAGQVAAALAHHRRNLSAAVAVHAHSAQSHG